MITTPMEEYSGSKDGLTDEFAKQNPNYAIKTVR